MFSSKVRIVFIFITLSILVIESSSFRREDDDKTVVKNKKIKIVEDKLSKIKIEEQIKMKETIFDILKRRDEKIYWIDWRYNRPRVGYDNILKSRNRFEKNVLIDKVNEITDKVKVDMNIEINDRILRDQSIKKRQDYQPQKSNRIIISEKKSTSSTRSQSKNQSEENSSKPENTTALSKGNKSVTINEHNHKNAHIHSITPTLFSGYHRSTIGNGRISEPTRHHEHAATTMRPINYSTTSHNQRHNSSSSANRSTSSITTISTNNKRNEISTIHHKHHGNSTAFNTTPRQFNATLVNKSTQKENNDKTSSTKGEKNQISTESHKHHSQSVTSKQKRQETSTEPIKSEPTNMITTRTHNVTSKSKQPVGTAQSKTTVPTKSPIKTTEKRPNKITTKSQSSTPKPKVTVGELIKQIIHNLWNIMVQIFKHMFQFA